MNYNIYCDESAHLLNHDQQKMVLGAIRAPSEQVRRLSSELRALKVRHGISSAAEIKWTKISPAKLDFYLALVDYFFAKPELTFRALVVSDKTKLDHEAHAQDHDTWYYKMYFSMLKVIITPHDRFCIYLDIKDSRSAEKTRRLHEVLSNSIHDFNRNVIERVQTVRSHEVELLQLADVLIGAVRRAQLSGEHLGHGAKARLVQHLREKSGYQLLQSTWLTESKFNIFVWEPREGAK